MRTHLALACSLLAALPSHGTPGSATLLLVDEPGFNEIEISIDDAGILINPSSATTTVSGDITVLLEIDPETDQVSELTVTEGGVAGTGLTLAGGGLASYSFTADSIGATLSTPDPPGLVDPPTGEFDSAQHQFAVDQGVLNGSVTFFGATTVIPPFDFAVAPVTGPGEGPGTVLLTETGSTPTSRTYQAVVILPISIMDSFLVEDPLTVTIDVTAGGMVKAAGPVTIPITPPNPYVAWTEANSIPAAPFDGDENGDGVPNGLLWSLGLAATDSPYPALLQPVGCPGATVDFTITLPAGGSAGDVTVLTTNDLESTPFTVLAPSAVSAGNPIPAGTTGTVTISLPKGSSDYVRLQATMP